ncbi:39S ribosomal protein l32, mitochondrial [Plakobranchus ocellatus]|uniref:Large ribosomal subunit protein bL32m n=1 Tax=Plakobranchus ocellatus TaxID=259542 RepID=A0AAV4DTF1_9GAST|nr:39S ribosomal protein l32, mitochondrial [Plakobranchus ocellatus]
MASPIRGFTLSFKKRWASVINDIRIIFDSFTGPPSGALATLDMSPHQLPRTEAPDPRSSLASIFDSILYAVPKHRRSVEKRLHRKHRFTGFMEYGTPKTNIIPCLECGNFKEKGHLCKYCYEKVRAETNEMQAKMGDKLQFDVPRSEMEFIYDNETKSEGTYAVQMSKPRPSWFPRKLLNKTGS